MKKDYLTNYIVYSLFQQRLVSGCYNLYRHQHCGNSTRDDQAKFPRPTRDRFRVRPENTQAAPAVQPNIDEQRQTGGHHSLLCHGRGLRHKPNLEGGGDAHSPAADCPPGGNLVLDHGRCTSCNLGSWPFPNIKQGRV